MKKTRKKGSGRTKGATSFVTVPLNLLNETLRSHANIVVSRRFAENIGISGKPFSATTKNIVAQSSIVEMTTTQPEESETVTFAKTEW